MPTDVDRGLLELSAAHAASQPLVPVPLSGATVRARASDFRALLEAERRLAETGRSGVRAVAPEIASARGPITKIVDVPAAPPTEEQPKLGSVALSLDPPALASPEAVASPAPESLPAARFLASERPLVQPRSRGLLRRLVAASLFAVVMAAALALLGVALLRQGLLHVPDKAAQGILRVMR